MHTRVYHPFHTGTAKRKRPFRRLGHGGIVVLSLVLLVYLAANVFFVPAYAVTAASNTVASPAPSAVTLAWPKTGQAAIGASGYGVLAKHNTGVPMPTASVIKTVMALSVLEKYPLEPGESGPTLTISQADVASYQWYVAHHGSVLPVRVGQRMTEHQALEATLLRSANNMADTLAVWAFGSLQNYQRYATKLVQRLGMNHTTIGSDASGLNPSTTSTAEDLVRLGGAVMENPVLANIVNKRSMKLPEEGIIYNTNNLLGVAGIVGIKTGTDTDNRGVYLFASRYEVSAGHTILIIGAIMGAPGITSAKERALPLLASAKRAFLTRTLMKAGQIVGNYQPAWLSESIPVRITRDVQVVDWRADPHQLNVSLNAIQTPVKAWDQVGHVFVTRHGEKVVASPVVLAQDIPQPSLWWRLTHPLASW